MIEQDIDMLDPTLLADWCEVTWHDGMRIHEDHSLRSVVAFIKPYGKPAKKVEIFEDELSSWDGRTLLSMRRKLFRQINDRFRLDDIADHWMEIDV